MANLMRLVGFCCHVCGWELMSRYKGVPIEMVCSRCNRQVHNECLEGKLFWILNPLSCKTCASERIGPAGARTTQQVALDN